ncbi:MAG: hypothetical protein AAGG50_03760 [Bacteroidota bacterium]
MDSPTRLEWAGFVLLAAIIAVLVALLTGCDGSDSEHVPTRTLVSAEVQPGFLEPGARSFQIQNNLGREFSGLIPGVVPGSTELGVALPVGTGYLLVIQRGAAGSEPPLVRPFATPTPGDTLTEIKSSRGVVFVRLIWGP